MPSWFVQSLSEVLVWTRRFQFDTTSECFCQESGTVPLNVGKRFKIVIFMKKKIILLQKILWSHGVQFWQLYQICFGSNLNKSRSEPKKSLKRFVSSRKVLPSESSAGHLECLTDETGVFLQIKISTEKLWNYIKLNLLPKFFFQKRLLVT